MSVSDFLSTKDMLSYLLFWALYNTVKIPAAYWMLEEIYWGLLALIKLSKIWANSAESSSDLLMIWSKQELLLSFKESIRICKQVPWPLKSKRRFACLRTCMISRISSGDTYRFSSLTPSARLSRHEICLLCCSFIIKWLSCALPYPRIPAASEPSFIPMSKCAGIFSLIIVSVSHATDRKVWSKQLTHISWDCKKEGSKRGRVSELWYLPSILISFWLFITSIFKWVLSWITPERY